jgi:hypothetical protein
MRKEEMIFYHQAEDNGKDGEYPPLYLRPITEDIYMISYLFIDV